VKFWLGAWNASWFKRTTVPLFVSHRQLQRLRTLPTATGPWALDSGGFTELNLHGRWVTTPADYVKAVARYRDEIGHLAWASPQDWMCEPFVISKTGLSVADHQQRTVTNLLELRDLAPHLPIIPVLQGWERDDYMRHVDAYAASGVTLEDEPLVGIGSVCRRQNAGEAADIVYQLSRLGLRLHGFGFKVTGLRRASLWLESSDSMAWSYRARRGNIRMAGCTHRKCSSCLAWALTWRAQILGAITAPKQDRLL
jgi:hypothetical protein